MNLRIFDSVDELVHGAARLLVQRIEGGARTIALSGGSTPKPLYALLGQPPLREQLAQFPITWVIVDERFVPFDDPQSNAGMIQKTLFAEGMSPSHRFLPFRTDLGDPETCARAFEEEWQTLGIVRLDVVLLGMGDDGHTASLFPGTDALAVEDRGATAVFVPKLDAWRVTITKPVIRDAALRVVLAAGGSKAPVLRDLRSGHGDYPIAQVTSGEIETWWLVDRAAVAVE